MASSGSGLPHIEEAHDDEVDDADDVDDVDDIEERMDSVSERWRIGEIWTCLSICGRLEG